MKLSECSDDSLLEEVKSRGLLICTNIEHYEIIEVAIELLVVLRKSYPDSKKVIDEVK